MPSSRTFCILLALLASQQAYCWGFFAHKKINYYAVFLLPPEMISFYKPNIQFIEQHAVDPDKKRYIVQSEGAHHYLDIDHYGRYPFDSLPRKWNEAVTRYSEDTLTRYGIVPWWVLVMEKRLTEAFRQKNKFRILKLSAEIGHYIADAHVPLHVSSNHNGQLTNQQGIHAFWESRIPELMADRQWNFFIGKALYIDDPSAFIWARVLESAASSDTVLRVEKELSDHFDPAGKYAYEERNGKLTRQYSEGYTRKYNDMLQGMTERRMKASVFAIASFWYTAWVNAGQPDLGDLADKKLTVQEKLEYQQLDKAWRLEKNKGDERAAEEQ